MDKDYKEIITDMNNLYKGYIKSKRTSFWKEETQKYEINWLINLKDLQQELLNETYKSGKPHKFILNERGKTRYISSYSMKDKIVRHVLCDEILFPVFEKYFIYDNGASQTGKGLSFTRNRFEVHLHKAYRKYKTNNFYILFCDFSKYYDNIRHEEVINMIKDKLNDDYIISLLSNIIDGFKVDVSYMSDEEYLNCLNIKYDSLQSRYEYQARIGEKFMRKSVDIGDQISQFIGIYYASKIDNYIKIVKSQQFYGRYMDDFYIISNSKELLNELLQDIKNISLKLGLFINDRKTHIVNASSNFTFLQTKYRMTNSGKLIKRIGTKKIVRMRRRLKKLSKIVEKHEMSYNVVKNIFKSWFNNFKKDMSYDQRQSITNIFNELLKDVKNND